MTPEVVHDHYLLVPVCITKDYIFRLEQHVKGTFGHCEVLNWNKRVRNEIIETWDKIANTHGGPIYALHDFHDRKQEKFLKMIGFRRLNVLPGLKEIWIWSNNGKSN